MPLTEEGFEVRRFDEVTESLISNIENQLNTTLSRDPDSVFTIMLSNIASEITDLNELAKAVYDSFDIYKATGVQLDNRAAQIGIYRQGERPTRGYAQFLFDDDPVDGITVPRNIPNNTLVSTSKGDTLSTDSVANISTGFGCYSFSYTLNAVAVGVAEQIKVNDETYVHVTAAMETKEDVAQSLFDAVEADPNKDYTVTLDGATLNFTYISETGNGLVGEIQAGQDSELGTVVGTVAVTNSVNGAVVILTGEINSITTSVDGASSVTNVTPLITGSATETDEELRARYLDSLQIAGVGTVDAIRDRVSRLDGVTFVDIVENVTNMTVNGRPANSFEVIVNGGENANIAQTIWDTKPASATTYGAISQPVVDAIGDIQYVEFSRPVPIYIWVEVSYNLYSEEVFPSDGRNRIANSLAESSSDLELGEDIFPQKLLGAIYSATDGLGTVTTRIAASLSPTVLTPDIPYTSDPLSIDDNQQPVILADKVTFITPIP